MRKRLCSAVLLAALFTGIHAAAWDNTSVQMSAWATGEVQNAYDSGVVSEDFNLGTDYTRPVTRGELARLTVDLILHERQQPIDDLIAQLGITLQAVPLAPAEPSDPADETNAPAAGQDNPEADANTSGTPTEDDTPQPGTTETPTCRRCRHPGRRC